MDECARGFEAPDTTLNFPHGCLETVALADGPAGRMTMHPGWRWSNDLKPTMGTETCQARHVGYCLQGTLHVEFLGGETLDIAPGQLFVIPPGHDAWVAGDETCVILDWGAQIAQAGGRS